MCGRFTLAASAEELADWLGSAEMQAVQARYNLAPTQLALTVKLHPGGHREPHWSFCVRR